MGDLPEMAFTFAQRGGMLQGDGDERDEYPTRADSEGRPQTMWLRAALG
jgi:hypothetical protein